MSKKKPKSKLRSYGVELHNGVGIFVLAEDWEYNVKDDLIVFRIFEDDDTPRGTTILKPHLVKNIRDITDGIEQDLDDVKDEFEDNSTEYIDSVIKTLKSIIKARSQK